MNTQHKNLKFLWLALFAVLTLFIGARWNFPLAAWLAPVFAIRFYRDGEVGGRAFLWLWLGDAGRFVRSTGCCMDKAEINYFAGRPCPITLSRHTRVGCRNWPTTVLF